MQIPHLLVRPGHPNASKGATFMVLIALLVIPARAGFPEFVRYHVGTGAGVCKLFGKDGGTGWLAGLSLRYSVDPVTDLAIDCRGWEKTSARSEWRQSWWGSGLFTTTTETNCLYIGFGARINGSKRHFAQGSIYWAKRKVTVTEKVTVGGEEVFFPYTLSESGRSGLGLGLMGGADIPVTSSFSLPIEVCLLLARPGESIVCAGISVVLEYNFGKGGPKEED